MADFEDRLDQANLDRLNKTLAGVEDVLQRNLAAGERAAESSEATRRQVQQRAVREGRGVTSRAGLVPEGTKATPDDVRDAERIARAAEQRERAERRVNDALGRRAATGELETSARAQQVQNAVRRAQAAETIAAAESVQRARQGRADRLTMEEAVQRAQASERQLQARRQADALTQRTFAQGPPQLGPGRQPGATPIGAGGGGGGPIIPPTTFGAPEPRGPRGDFNAHLGDLAQHENLARRAQQADLEWRNEMERLSRTIGINSDDLRRHGALTTEFISAAARGQVEIRELGYQVGATVGKFAGWTAAAALVFGAADAMRQLGTGAIEGGNAVNQTQRIIENLDTERATKDIRALSEQFNVPIADVGAAVYGSAKVFQDYEKTIGGAKQALFAMKVGELEAGDATRYLNSIVRAFPGADMEQVFDTINEAQNRFGGNLGEIIAGVARAGNAFRNAGGDYRELVALIQTGSLQTGRPGLEIATGIQRSAEMILRPERRKRIIDLLGVDPTDTSITDLYREAMKQVQDMAPEEAAAVARALSTPELATGRILPILQAGPRFEEIASALDPAKVVNSAADELARTLQGPTEQLQSFGNEVQQLGAALGGSGILDPLIAMVGALREAVDLTGDLVELVDGIAGPLAPVVFGFAQIAAAVALMRRFNTGGLFPEGSAGRNILGRNPARLERAQIMQGMGFQREFLENEQRQAGQRMAMNLRNVERERAVFTRMANDPEVDEDNLDRQRERVKASVDRQADLWNEHANASGELERTQRQINTFQTETKGARGRDLNAVRAAATRSDITYTGNIGPLPVAGAAQRLDDPTRPGFQRGGLPGDMVTPGFSRDDPLGRSMEQQEREMRSVRDENRKLSSRMARLGTTGRALGATASGVSRAASGAGRALVGAGAAIGAAATMLGPLDVILAGVLVGLAALDAAAKQADQAEAIFADPGSIDALRSRAEKELGDRSKLDAVQGAFADAVRGTLGKTYLGEKAGLGNIQGPDQAADDAARSAKKEADQLARQRQRGRMLLQSQIRARLQARLADADTEKERQRAIEQAEKEMRSSYGAVHGVRGAAGKRETELSKQAIRQAKADLESGAQSLADRLKQIEDAEGVADFVLRTQNRQALGDIGEGTARSRLRGAARRARSLAKDAEDPEVVAKLLQEAEKAQEAYIERAARGLEGIEYLSTSRQGAARQRYIAQLRQLLGGKGATKDDRFQLAQEIREQQRAQYEAELAAGDARGSRLETQTTDPLARARMLRNRMRQRVARVREAVRRGIANQNELEQALAEQAQAQQQVAEEALSAFQGEQELATARFEAGLPSESAKLQRAVSDASAFEQRVRAQGGAVAPQRLIEAQTAVARAQQAMAEYVREQAQDLIRAQAEDEISRTEDPVKQAEARVREAERLARFAETPADRLRASADVRNRRREARQTRQQEAYEVIEFEASIGKMDREAHISRLSALLKTIHGNRDLRKQIQQRIYQLKQETEDDSTLSLGLDGIKLPTTYEIRRAIGYDPGDGSGRSSRSQVNNNTFNVEINDREGAEEFGRQLERGLGVSRVNLRSQGVLG